MATYFNYALITLYWVALSGLGVFGLHRIWLLIQYARVRGRRPRPANQAATWPTVTVQLPIFNEVYVVERLIRALSRLCYPAGLLEVHVLDSSTDETAEIARQVCESLRDSPHKIRYVHYGDRTGFKAGSLQKGLEATNSELIAIFDADFVPPPDFLEQVIPHFQDAQIGMVQTRWTYLNERFSWITRVQALFLDGHFMLEQLVRSRTGKLFNFNGTAGVWRRQCLVDAGGWHFDSLTEDLDVSYRAQLQGWKFVFAPEIASPSELPVDLNALKTQQHRWVKGSVQTCRKQLRSVWSSGLPFLVRLEALAHLAHGFAYVFLLLLGLLVMPVVLLRHGESTVGLEILEAGYLGLGIASVTLFYVVASYAGGAEIAKRSANLPFLFLVGIGLSLNNTLAVLEGLLSGGGEFVRTPKLDVIDCASNRGAVRKDYLVYLGMVPWLELTACGYFAWGVVWTATHGCHVAGLFLLLFCLGFLLVGGQSLRQNMQVLTASSSTT
ncbi:glycosyltransferase family 2 protein [Planctomycetota bacterium]